MSEYLCKGLKHYAWGSEARLQDADGNEGFIKITGYEKSKGFEMPVEGMPYEYDGDLYEDSSPHAPVSDNGNSAEPPVPVDEEQDGNEEEDTNSDPE